VHERLRSYTTPLYQLAHAKEDRQWREARRRFRRELPAFWGSGVLEVIPKSKAKPTTTNTPTENAISLAPERQDETPTPTPAPAPTPAGGKLSEGVDPRKNEQASASGPPKAIELAADHKFASSSRTTEVRERSGSGSGSGLRARGGEKTCVGCGQIYPRAPLKVRVVRGGKA
jgi:hypothetical protein